MAEALITYEQLHQALVREKTDLAEGVLSEDFLGPVVSRVSALAEAYCDRVLKASATDSTFVLEGNGSAFINLADQGGLPIISVTAVTVDGDEIPERPDSNSSGWYLNPEHRRLGRIYLDGYSATLGYEVSVEARVGYDDQAEDDLTTPELREHANALLALEQACLDWAVYLVKNFAPGAEQISLGEGMALSFAEKSMPTRVRGMLDRYRRLTCG